MKDSRNIPEILDSCLKLAIVSWEEWGGLLVALRDGEQKNVG